MLVIHFDVRYVRGNGVIVYDIHVVAYDVYETDGIQYYELIWDNLYSFRVWDPDDSDETSSQSSDDL